MQPYKHTQAHAIVQVHAIARAHNRTSTRKHTNIKSQIQRRASKPPSPRHTHAFIHKHTHTSFYACTHHKYKVRTVCTKGASFTIPFGCGEVNRKRTSGARVAARCSRSANRMPVCCLVRYSVRKPAAVL